MCSASESRMCSRICSGEDLSDKCSVCSVSSRESLSQDCLNCGSNTGGGSVCKLTMNGQTYTTYTVFLANASVDCTCSPPCRTCSDNSVGCTMCSIECERCVSEVSASPGKTKLYMHIHTYIHTYQLITMATWFHINGRCYMIQIINANRLH